MAWHEYPYPSYEWEFQGVDFASMGTMTPQIAEQMAIDGISFVGRYLFAERIPFGKGITAEEAQMYLDHGIAIFLYYEVNTDDALNGYNRGVYNGERCLEQAIDVGVPENTLIFCACDTAVSLDQANGIVMEYLEGFNDGLGPGYSVGIYGGANVVQAAYNNGFYNCQAGAWGDLEFEPINVRQWYISYNNAANRDGYLKLKNIEIDTNGYAQWNGFAVDLCSAPDTAGMWGGGPRKKKHKMPIWLSQKKF